MGGMGIRDPVETARLSYLTSKVSSAQIISTIKGEKDFCFQSHNEEIYIFCLQRHSFVRNNTFKINKS